jgi:hypothetical protein
MPKWEISLTRDASQDASVIIEAESAGEAEEIFDHDMDHDAIEWTEGDWLGDTEIVEILPADDRAKPTALTRPDTPLPIVEGLDAVAKGILEVLEDDAGKGRVFFGLEEVLRLRGLVDKVAVITRELRPPLDQHRT